MSTALGDPTIARLRRLVAEFEPVFEEVLRSDGPNADPFRAMGAFGEWLLDRLHAGDYPPDFFARIFAVIEDLGDDPELLLGADLRADFYETVQGDPLVAPYLPPADRERVLANARARESSLWRRLWRRG